MKQIGKHAYGPRALVLVLVSTPVVARIGIDKTGLPAH
jgi:hypothetical protein